MEKNVRKVWFAKGKSWHCIACRPPYREEDAILDGIPLKEWLEIPALETQEFHDPPHMAP